MSTYNRPARDILTLPGGDEQAKPPVWAIFDADWYRMHYTDAPAGTDEALLEWHLSHGQGDGHSPNLYFDEMWQRHNWPGIEAVIEAGTVSSAYDAWCRGPHATRPPHWLFSPGEYRKRFPALTDESLASAGLVNLYDHYLKFGAAEGRIGHALFDPAVYLAGLEPDEAEAASTMPFAHYLLGLDKAAGDRETSVLFDQDWYHRRYRGAARLVTEGKYRSLLEHYLCNDCPQDYDPSPWFSEEHYISRYPGVAKSIGPQGFRNGFAHFLAFGLEEGRSPHPDLDLAWYAGLGSVKAAIESGRSPDAFTHWIAIGHSAGFPGRAPPETGPTEAQAVALYRRKAEVIWPLFGRCKLDFTAGNNPVVSVIMTVSDRFVETLVSLASLRAQYRGDIELILIDSSSARPGTDLAATLTGATVLRFDSPLTSAAARDAGLGCARGGAVLLLGDGVELAPGAIDTALGRLGGDTTIGAVGGRLVQPHGALLEAGGILWRDGRLQSYLQDKSPLVAEANFVRAVDFCSTRFLMARRDVLTMLPEQPAGVAGTTHDAAELCVRIREAGFRVVYEPDAVAFLTAGVACPEANGQAAFVAAHPAYLEARPLFDPAHEVRARTMGSRRKRVLFVEDTIPLRSIGSGFVRSNDVVRAMVEAGASVTVFPINGSRFDLASIRADLPDSVEAMHDLSVADFDAFAAERRGYYDVIWVARTHNLAAIREKLIGFGNPPGTGSTIIADTEALASMRLAEQAALEGRAFDQDAALREELHPLAAATRVLAVTEAEAEIIRAYHHGAVNVLGHGLSTRPTPRRFEERTGILFVGAIHDMGHPNYDSLVWFVDEILPLIEQKLHWRTRLTVAGYLAPGVNLDRFTGHPRINLRGPMTDLAPLYDAHRVFVAPTRFAAGIPYKVHEAAAFGVPVVATGLLARQLGWTAGEALETANVTDPASFAERVIALHEDPRLWQQIREAALHRVAMELDPTDFVSQIAGLLWPERGQNISIRP